MVYIKDLDGHDHQPCPPFPLKACVRPYSLRFTLPAVSQCMVSALTSDLCIATLVLILTPTPYVSLH